MVQPMKRGVAMHYYATNNVRALPGVMKKISQFVDCAGAMGYDSRLITAEPGLKGQLALALTMLRDRSDIVVMRCTLYTALLYLVPMLALRARGITVIIDVPTPITIALFEALHDKNVGLTLRIARVASLLVNFPLALAPASLVVQYAVESRYFGWFRRSMLMGNGIDPTRIRERPHEPDLSDGVIHLIAVSSMAFWHGCDRLLYSLSRYEERVSRQSEPVTHIELWIVGDGAERGRLLELAMKLGIERRVHFTGQLDGSDLDAIYDRCHIAVASMALYRKKAGIASELKVREYLCKGMPLVLSADDVDLRPVPDFVFKVQNDDSEIPLSEIVAWFATIFQPGYSSRIRAYAESRLSYATKIERIFERAGARRSHA